MTHEQKLALGIEIVAAMKANAYGVDIEEGREMALEDTEIDRMDLSTPFEECDEDDKALFIRISAKNKERLHTQALYVADVAISKLQELFHDLH